SDMDRRDFFKRAAATGAGVALATATETGWFSQKAWADMGGQAGATWGASVQPIGGGGGPPGPRAPRGEGGGRVGPRHHRPGWGASSTPSTTASGGRGTSSTSTPASSRAAGRSRSSRGSHGDGTR